MAEELYGVAQWITPVDPVAIIEESHNLYNAIEEGSFGEIGFCAFALAMENPFTSKGKRIWRSASEITARFRNKLLEAKNLVGQCDIASNKLVQELRESGHNAQWIELKHRKSQPLAQKAKSTDALIIDSGNVEWKAHRAVLVDGKVYDPQFQKYGLSLDEYLQRYFRSPDEIGVMGEFGETLK